MPDEADKSPETREPSKTPEVSPAATPPKDTSEQWQCAPVERRPVVPQLEEEQLEKRKVVSDTVAYLDQLHEAVPRRRPEHSE